MHSKPLSLRNPEIIPTGVTAQIDWRSEVMEDEDVGKLVKIASMYCYSDLPIEAIAWQLHLDEKEVRRIVDELTKAGGLRIFVEQSDTPLEKIMTVDVVALDGSRTLTDAAGLMAKRQIGSVIVTENDIPFGIITERDIVRRLGVGDEQFFRDARLGDVCSHPLIVAEPNLTVGEAVDIMVKNKIHKLPVVGRGKLLGIVTIKDLAKFLSPPRTPSITLSVLRAVSREEKTQSI